MTKESLNEKRDELAGNYASDLWSKATCKPVVVSHETQGDFKKGFDACAELMQEEIELLTATVKEREFTNNFHLKTLNKIEAENDKLRDAGKALVETLKYYARGLSFGYTIISSNRYAEIFELPMVNGMTNVVWDIPTGEHAPVKIGTEACKALQTHGKVFEGDK